MSLSKTKLGSRGGVIVLLLNLVAASWAPWVFADVPTAEHDALVALYTSTNGSGWTISTHWNTTDPVCPGTPANNWVGIACDAGNTTVTGISLGSNNLTGTLSSLAGLPNLASIDVSFNGLTGDLPALAGLTHLTYFDANFNSLTGPIPPLAGLTNLRQFLVENNALSGGIPTLQGLSALQAFEVDRNLLTGPIPPLTGLTTLTYLSVFSNQLSGGFPDLTGLTQLNALLLSNNRLSGGIPVDALAIPTDLIYFQIDHNGFTGAIPTAPTTLTAGQSAVCPNLLDHSASSAWDAATGVSPWYTDCNELIDVTAISSISPNPPEAGVTVTVNFSVSPGSGAVIPTGSVTISDSVDASATCSAALSGGGAPYYSSSGLCTLSFISAGAHTLTAAYSGDSSYAPSSGTFDLTVLGVNSMTTLSATPDPATVGQAVTTNVVVTDPLVGLGGPVTPPSGSVVLSDSVDSTATCTAMLSGIGPGRAAASCVLTFATVGPHTLTASFPGDAVYNPSNSTFAETVDPPLPAVPAPTLDRWGLFALIFSVGLVAVYRQGKRR